MTTEAQRAAFEAWLDDPHPMNQSLKRRDFLPLAHQATAEMVWAGATEAATLAERERAARVCEGLIDTASVEKASKKVHEARGEGGALELSTLRHAAAVDLFNCSIKKCAAAIREGV